jgi:hypothetical protein
MGGSTGVCDEACLRHESPTPASSSLNRWAGLQAGRRSIRRRGGSLQREKDGGSAGEVVEGGGAVHGPNGG